MYKLVILFLFLFGCQLSTGEVVKIKSSIKLGEVFKFDTKLIKFLLIGVKLFVWHNSPKSVDL